MTILMKRGEIWTAAGGSDYGAKPRPVVIIQDDQYDSTKSITICPLTSHSQSTQVARLPIMPNDLNGLRLPCRLMIDKISTVPRNKLRAKIGQLDEEDVTRLNRSIIVFLGIAGALSEEEANE
jgi:mRNA interferase MazF